HRGRGRGPRRNHPRDRDREGPRRAADQLRGPLRRRDRCLGCDAASLRHARARGIERSRDPDRRRERRRQGSPRARRACAAIARKVDVRIVSATNRRLAEAARKEEFRSDLFYRLAVVRVTVPPLRERREDVVPIARAILKSIRPGTELAPDLAAILEGHAWPG